ncbi:MAG: hypothetical protein JJT77_13355 [Crocinitomicaceae bacterium]|nr:hypothetical protein [Crocinitomicaceae bacterium]
MNKKDLFLQMLEDSKRDNFGFIGTGNPDAKILLLGKEVATDDSDEEYHKNLIQWERDIQKTVWDIPTRFYDERTNSPLCPYKGQYLKRYDNKDNWGTSVTWINYQKLHNHIFGDSYGRINFHKNFFISEVNGVPSRKTNGADTSTVENRKLFFSKSSYFQNFPVVILGGVGYFKFSENQNEIEEIFGVKFKEKCLAGGKENQPYWLHWSEDETKLVINTHQLSMNISDKLLQEIANHISKHLQALRHKNSFIHSTHKWYSQPKEVFNEKDFNNIEDYHDYLTWL